MTAGGFSSRRLARVRELLERQVDSGFVPGVVAVLARHGEVHVEATGTLAFEGAGSRTPMARDTICRMGSMTKPIVAACAMTLVEDCTLRLDDPVDELLPELADMTVLADPERAAGRHRPGETPDNAAGPADLHPRHRHGPGRAGNDPDRRRAGCPLQGRAGPDEWIRRLGALPLVHQPGERWMYETAARRDGRAHRPRHRQVLRGGIARADLRSAGDEGHRVQRGRGEHRPAGDGVRGRRFAAGEPSSKTAPDGQLEPAAGVRESVAAGWSRRLTTTSRSPRPCSPAVPTTASGCSRGRR